MSIEMGLGLLAVVYILYMLLVRGLLYKIVVCIFGWFGLYAYLIHTWQLDKVSPFKDDFMSWAAIIPTFFVVMAIAKTKEV